MREKSMSYRKQDPNIRENGGRTLKKCENSLVISWLGMGVARVLRMNASVPMVEWKDEHPQSVGWWQPVIDKRFPTLCNLVLTVMNWLYYVCFRNCAYFLMDILYLPYFCLIV
jgi:hypothetical protein